jgi:hypothetical protein
VGNPSLQLTDVERREAAKSWRTSTARVHQSAARRNNAPVTPTVHTGLWCNFRNWSNISSRIHYTADYPLPSSCMLLSLNRVDYLDGRNTVGHVAYMEDKRTAYELLVSKTGGKRSLEAKSTNTGIQRNGVCVCVDWTQVANNRHQ